MIYEYCPDEQWLMLFCGSARHFFHFAFQCPSGTRYNYVSNCLAPRIHSPILTHIIHFAPCWVKFNDSKCLRVFATLVAFEAVPFALCFTSIHNSQNDVLLLWLANAMRLGLVLKWASWEFEDSVAVGAVWGRRKQTRQTQLHQQTNKDKQALSCGWVEGGAKERADTDWEED